ncbi:MAG: hypothetical protein MUF01_13085 [Bryobacterales bacterium]|nr:hypothetical protein [Bryobacterales bacterium]
MRAISEDGTQCPGFPARFGSMEDARGLAVDFFAWYNHQRLRPGISLPTPSALHHGQAPEIIVK